MNRKEAIEILKNYPCVCKYGTSPCNCEDSECDFGKAIRVLTQEAENDKKECNEIRSLSELGFQDLNDGIVDPTYIDDGVDCSDMGIFSWGDS